jgi:hypothetical protein
MAKFDWIPYLEGKYLSYYQWFAVIGSTVLLLLSFLSFVIYLILSKIKFHELQYEKGEINQRKSITEKSKDFFFSLTFTFLSIIPLICAGLDVTYFIVGFVGMAIILIIKSIL